MSAMSRPVKIASPFALAIFLAISSPVAFAQNITVDGNNSSYSSPYNNYNNYNTAIVNNGGYLRNRDNVRIESATANYRGYLINWESAHIESVNVNEGQLENYYNSSAGSVIVNDGGMINSDYAHTESVTVNGDSGWFNNDRNATIGSATINGWKSSNYGNAAIGSVTVNGGGLNNYDDATIGTATINNNGWLGNRDKASIGSVTVNGGNLYNYNTATIGTTNLFGGTVENGSRINEMTYAGGTYKGIYSGKTGTIGTLILATNSANNTGNWGIIENLQFAEDGIASFTGNTDAGFSGIKAAGNVNLAGGNIAIGLAGTMSSSAQLFDIVASSNDDWVSDFFNAFESGFSLRDLFGATSVSGAEGLFSFELTFGDESYWIVEEGVVKTGWQINSSGIMSRDTGSGVPEPATLGVLVFGLAGVGLARRRR